MGVYVGKAPAVGESMKADAIITMYREWHEDPLHPGSGYATDTPVRWEGGAIARLPWECLDRVSNGPLQIGDYLFFGPWLLEVVDREPWSRNILVTRNLNWAWWYALRFRAAHAWQPFKCRVIATCAVWGLARYEWNASASWSEIYTVAWLQRKLRRP